MIFSLFGKFWSRSWIDSWQNIKNDSFVFSCILLCFVHDMDTIGVDLGKCRSLNSTNLSYPFKPTSWLFAQTTLRLPTLTSSTSAKCRLCKLSFRTSDLSGQRFLFLFEHNVSKYSVKWQKLFHFSQKYAVFVERKIQIYFERPLIT